MSEIEQEIECFNNKVWSGELFESEVDMYNAVIGVLRAELEREKNPLTCDGCGAHMTNREAIELIKAITLPYNDHDHGVAIEEARRMAIFALESPRDWTTCAEGMPTPDAKYTDGSNQMYWVTLSAEGKTMNGLFGYFTHPESKNGYWHDAITNRAIPTLFPIIAWQPLPAPYRADATTGKLQEDTEC